MNEIPQGFIEVLTTLGLPGVIIFALGFVVYVLDRRNADIQEKRLSEARDGFSALKENTTALNALSSAISQTPRRR